MSQGGHSQGPRIALCVHQLRQFVTDRCSDIGKALKLDKRIRPASSGQLRKTSSPQGEHSGSSTYDDRATEGHVALHQPLTSSPGISAEKYVSREELGRATWLLLHTLAAQYPDRPSKQQKKDVTTLVDLMTRVYPCGECAEGFQAIVRDNAPSTGSGAQLRLWMCEAHNAVNQSLGKPEFNCNFVDARWGGVECEGETACSLFGGPRKR